MRKNLLLVVAIAASTAADASEIALRAGLETPLYTHTSQGGQSRSISIGDTFQPAINVLAEYYPASPFGIGIELREGFAATGTYQRTGTSIGPSLTLDFSPLPIFVRGALPIHVEPDPVHIDFRAAGGLRFLILYAELIMDFPLAGGTNVSAFNQQQFGLGAGIWLKF